MKTFAESADRKERLMTLYFTLANALAQYDMCIRIGEFLHARD